LFCEILPAVTIIPPGSKVRWVSDAHLGFPRGESRTIRFVSGLDDKLAEIVANILPENLGMLALSKHYNFKIREGEDPDLVIGVSSL
jgi:hypothetical protein